ncbi:TonB-dependent receptor [Arenibacter sp. ARW7G5Y1]|uniref:SusC/RagA family TonB-linked outer membrane protein n=1 Tax=Arenibacter sp. ARW7G5Y1 TaxID=2135619 RepID=UPI000D755E42|nr:TonB-dependent receptor [Arenibacter sp. ARW7G5Y1]PXX22831.1 TonB-linked SusC/RagA family outer membrane protein [Arenibacter sp. ARW7G5Y1]
MPDLIKECLGILLGNCPKLKISFFLLLMSVLQLHAGATFDIASKSLTIEKTNVQQVVSGTVVDQMGTPLPGANIVEKGTTNGVTADFDGNFSIDLSGGNTILVVSYIGYATKEVPVLGQANLIIALEESASGLDEVVVVGYGTQKKINLTGAVSTVQAEDLTQVKAPNVTDMLTGKAPGLFIKQNGGVPGADVGALSIRGFGAPLVLVDGVEGSWNRMDPNEIESISVLKDAAAAVYGARAGNGVVLITTKRGKAGETMITYSRNYSFQRAATVPEWVPSWKMAELKREGELNSQLPYTYTEAEVQKFKDGNDPNYPNENWYEATLKKQSTMDSHTLSASGGTEKVKYFLNAGYLNQNSLFRSDDLKFGRYNFRSNIDVQITDRVNVTFNAAYRNEQTDSPHMKQIGVAANGIGQTWTQLQSAQPMLPAALPDPTLGGAYSGFQSRSPIANSTSDFSGFESLNEKFFSGRVSLNYKIPGINGLVANATLNYNTQERYNKIQDKVFRVLSYNYDSDDYTEWPSNGTNSLNEETYRYTSIYPLVTLNYKNTFKKHSFEGLLLAEGIDTESSFLEAGRVDLIAQDLPYLFVGSTANLTNNGGAEETGRVSYVGRVNYSYLGKYLIEGTVRFDASHKFPSNSRWGTFPSISAAWRISEESFIQNNLSWISNLKLRASYSNTGNDNVTAFRYLTGYQILQDQSDVYLFGDDLYREIRTTGLPNRDITWLENTSYNIGLDASFGNGLIGLEFDWFYRLTDNIFAQPIDNYPSTFGAVLPQLNLNSTEDRGVELTLTHKNNIGKDFRYNLWGSVSYAREKYKKWAESPFDDPDEIRIFQKSGNYTNRWIGYKSDGLFMSQDEIDNHPVNQDQADNATIRPGDIKYIDINGDNVIDFRDQDEIGYGTFPDLTYALNMQLDYKGFSLSAMFQGASMFNNYIGGSLAKPLTNNSVPYEFQYKYRWQPDPENPDVNINPEARLPAILGDDSGTSLNNQKVSDFWLKDATYIRLKNLSMGYDFPETLIGQIGLKGLRMNLTGSNLFTLSKLGIYKDTVDPESTGGQQFYPVLQTFSIGFDIKL